MIAMQRSVYEATCGFDEGIANHLTEPDMCLSAKKRDIQFPICLRRLVSYIKRPLTCQMTAK